MEENTLTTIAQDMLTEAREASSGRSAHHLNGGREHTLQQTMIALAEGQDLKEHENPGEATIQVSRAGWSSSPATNPCSSVLPSML